MLAAVDRLQSRAVPDVTQISFAIMASTLIINIGVSSYEYILGRRLKSSILVADSMQHQKRYLCLPGSDPGPVCGQDGLSPGRSAHRLFICLLIVHTGLEILKESSTALLDRAAVDEQVIVDLARSVEGVLQLSCPCAPGAWPRRFMWDLHIGVDASLSMDKAHEVGEDVERAIKSRIPEVRDVVVHLGAQGLLRE